MCIQHRPYTAPKLKFDLRDQGYEAFWPRLLVRKYRQNDQLVPLFVGYLFCRIDPGQGWGKIALTANVLSILGAKEFGKPSTVPTGWVDALIARAGAIDLPIDETPEARQRLRPGPIRMNGGPFDQLSGMLTEDRGEDRVDVLFEIMGMPRKVRVPREQVRAE